MQQRRFKTVLGMYPTRSGVEIAVEAFHDAGFRTADISLVLPKTMTYDDLCAEQAAASGEALQCGVEVLAPDGPLPAADALDNAPRSAGRSCTAAGPVARNLEGSSQAASPELAATLIDLGIPAYETEGYAGKVRGGKALLSIYCDSPEQTLAARRLHGDLGGMDVFVAHSADQGIGKGRSMACSAGR